MKAIVIEEVGDAENLVIKDILAPTFPLDQMALAHKQQETGRTVG